MTQITRRAFVGSTAAVPLGLAVATGARAQDQAATGRATLVVTGGRVLTMNPDMPVAEAVAIQGDRIMAVGSNDDILGLAGADTEQIDARDMTVTPGFIDAHSHPHFTAEAVGANVNLRRIDDVKLALAGKAAETPPGHWVQGVMYDDTKFDEGRPLNRDDIDQAVSDHPVYVAHRGGHTGVVNSKALELAGIGPDTPDPVGGRYFREGGRLTGKVAEHAREAFFDVGTWPVIDREVRRRAATISSQNMAAAGLTSTTDASGGLEALIAYQDARAANELHFRLSFMPRGSSDVYRGLRMAGVRSGFGDNMIRIGAVKYAADGSASERTMHMSTPFEGTDDHGILTMSQEDINSAVDDAVNNGFRIGIHANGDVTIDMVLSAYERVLRNHTGPNPRLRIEHCSLVTPSLVARIRDAGVIPTPFYTYAHYHGNKWPDYGPEKMESMFAHRSFLDAGIPVAPASDFTPGPYEPMMAIQSMVTRKDVQGRVWGASQRITVSEAMRICTVNGAYASFEEDIKGSLETGKLADFVLLEDDPHDVDPDAIKEIKIVRTVLGGRTTYES